MTAGAPAPMVIAFLSVEAAPSVVAIAESEEERDELARWIDSQPEIHEAIQLLARAQERLSVGREAAAERRAEIFALDAIEKDER